jgi:DNA-binding GntR family transcriptional regulator
MKVLKKRRAVLDAEAADHLRLKAGQEWAQASVLRYLPREAAPVASMEIYVRPEHADVLDLIDKAGVPVFSLIEKRHGVRIAEVSQQIVGITLSPVAARMFKTRQGSPALEITRQYTDTSGRIVMASLGHYPSDRFSHDTKFRIQPLDHEESRA